MRKDQGLALKWLPSLAFILAGGITSALDWFGACSESCAEASLYRLFGFPMPPLGVAYFTMCAAAWFLRRRHPVFYAAFAALLFGGLGAELRFTWIQWKVIGTWCLMCVIIAWSVAGACAMLLLEYFLDKKNILSTCERISLMKRLPILKCSFAHATLMLLVFLCGFGVATFGLKKPDAVAATVTAETMAFGPADSNQAVYIISDWFCSACRIAEPEIIKGARAAMKQARVYFVDYPIHPETMNFIPYNIAFMTNEKEKYLKIREALAALALKTKEPTAENVQAAVSPLGVRYVPLNFADVYAGTQIQTSVINRFKPGGTPEIIVFDLNTEKTIRLTGSREVTAEKILKAISEVSAK